MGTRGRLIILTGINGTGKTEQAGRLMARTEATKQQLEYFHVLRATPGVTAMRAVVLGEETHPTSLWAQILAFYAMHAESAEAATIPKLESGRNILLDRGPESTHVYSIIGEAAEGRYPEAIGIYEKLMSMLKPDLVLVLDAPVDVAVRRATKQGETDYLQDHEREVHERRRHGFLDLAAADPGTWKVVDASGTPEEVEEKVWELVSAVLS